MDERDDVFGDGVNVAARVESLAPSGGVLVSDKRVSEPLRHPDQLTISGDRIDAVGYHSIFAGPASHEIPLTISAHDVVITRPSAVPIST